MQYIGMQKQIIRMFDKNKESLYIQYLNANNLYEWTMSQTLPVDGFKWKNIC